MYLRDGKNPFDSMNEECGVFGVYSAETRDVAHTVYYGLYAVCLLYTSDAADE